MRRMVLTTVLAGTTLLAPFLIPTARASYNWFSIGSVFRVGAAHIAFVFGRPFGYPAAYYYRYDRKAQQWRKFVIDYGSHVGTGLQLTAVSLRRNGRLDLICPGKSGLYLFENQGIKR